MTGVPVLVQPETAGPLLAATLTPVLRPSSAPRRLPAEESRPGGARLLALLLLALLAVLAAGCRRQEAPRSSFLACEVDRAPGACRRLAAEIRGDIEAGRYGESAAQTWEEIARIYEEMEVPLPRQPALELRDPPPPEKTPGPSGAGAGARRLATEYRTEDRTP